MLSDEWLPRYRLLENFTAKWNGNGNAYNRGDYNSSFALRAVELKSRFSHDVARHKHVDLYIMVTSLTQGQKFTSRSQEGLQ